jgi:hypothetical protein
MQSSEQQTSKTKAKTKQILSDRQGQEKEKSEINERTINNLILKS